MLDILEVRNAMGSLLTLPLEDDSDGISVQKIEGLGPVKATLVSSGFASMDGAQFHSSKREPRNIKLTLGLDPDYAVDSVEILRSRVYEHFMTESEVTLRFRTTEELDVDILGHVETCEPAIFEKEPVMEISLMCYKPDFVDRTPTSFAGWTTSDLTETIVPYSGTVDTGFVLSIPIDRSVSDVTIYHQPPDGTLRTMYFSNPLLAGDILRISTVAGSKAVTRVRAGVETSLLYALTPQSPWLELKRGDNKFRVYATGATIPFTLDYTTKYGGL